MMISRVPPSALSSSGFAAGSCCSVVRRPPRTRSCSYCALRSPCVSVRPGQPDDRPVRRPGAGAAGSRFGWPRAAYCLRRRAVQPSPGRRRRRPPASDPADSRPGQRLLLATVRLAGPSQPQQQEIELHAAIAGRCTNGTRSVVAATAGRSRRTGGGSPDRGRCPACPGPPGSAAGCCGRPRTPSVADCGAASQTRHNRLLLRRRASRSWAGCCWSSDCSRPSCRIPPSVPFGQHLTRRLIGPCLLLGAAATHQADP